MNAKKLKVLRRLARQMAVNEKKEPLPEVEYLERTDNRKFVEVEKISGDGKSTYKDKEMIAHGTLRVSPKTVRGVYKKLKHQLNLFNHKI